MTSLRLPPKLMVQTVQRGGIVTTKLSPPVASWCRRMLTAGWSYTVEKEPYRTLDEARAFGLTHPVYLSFIVITFADPAEIVTFRRRWL